MESLWGIDLGGTKIEGVVLADDLRPSCRIRVETEQEGGYEHILSRIRLLFDLMAKESGTERPHRVGLGMPGTIEPSTGLVKNANTTCLIGRPLVADLSSSLESDVIAQNDANCFALAEATMGAAKEHNVVFGVILGTGVGGGIAVNGQVLAGHHGIAGEWGHNLLIPDGEPCYCGKRGCVETVISGPALERWYAAQTGCRRNLAEIAASDDPVAKATIDRLCEYFGKALAPLVNILDPDAIVLGGGVGNVNALYDRGLASLTSRIFNPRFDAKLTQPSLGDSAGVFGAAILARD